MSLDHEEEVLKQCEKLVEVSLATKDYKTLGLAQKFVAEQIDEIEKTTGLLDQLKTFGQSQESLRLLDTEMRRLASLE